MPYHPRCVQVQRTLLHPPTPPDPHPPNQHHAKKTTKKDKKRGFTEAKQKKQGKSALSLWRQRSELAKTLFRDAAFCARPANYIHTYVRTYIHTYIIPTVLPSRSFTTSFVFPSFPVPAKTIDAHYWKKLTCGVIRSFH